MVTLEVGESNKVVMVSDQCYFEYGDIDVLQRDDDINIKTTREGIVIDVTFDGEVRQSAWLTWQDIYDLTH